MCFKVQSKACSTCIYRKDSPLDLKMLEEQVADKYGGFKGHRVCHHSDDVCCRGFWNRHKDKFQAGQIAQRLGCVEFVNVDTLKEKKDAIKDRKSRRRRHEGADRRGTDTRGNGGEAGRTRGGDDGGEDEGREMQAAPDLRLLPEVGEGEEQ